MKNYCSPAARALISGAFFGTLSTAAFGHGLMVEPASRNALCGMIEKPDRATSPHCVDAFSTGPQAGGYWFMSVLTHNLGRSGVSPLPNNVCGFNSETWQGGATPWDTATSWPGQPATSGPLDIVWNISWGPHFDDTNEFRYWITKDNFNFSPTRALSWSDFEEAPFCVQNYEDRQPSANPSVIADKANARFTTKCSLPARQGHHVVYGEWGRKPPTLERFHGCIDLAFSDGPVAPVASAQNLTTAVDTAVAITLTGSDSDGFVTGYTVVTPPQHGQLTGSAEHRSYQPAPGFVGDDSFAFTVIDDDGLESSPANVNISVRDLSLAPTASFSAQVSGLVVNVDGSASSDPNNNALTYTWDFGDGVQLAGIQASHQYTTAGHYNITLTVSNGSASDSATEHVHIMAPATDKAVCEYVVNNAWNNGFVASIRLTNPGTAPISNWSVSWSYPSGVQLGSHWNANISGSGPYTATGVGWNNTIAPGQTVEFGLQGVKPSNVSAPTPVVSGAVCQ